MGKFVVKTVPSGIKFDLKAGNGEVIATSEVYTTEAACIKGIESVKKNAPVAEQIAWQIPINAAGAPATTRKRRNISVKISGQRIW